MKHRIASRTLGRRTPHRVAMLKTMVTQLLKHERIETTLPRCKELRKMADQVITLGKQGTNMARVAAGNIVREDSIMHKLFTTMADRYRSRDGGYTRIMRTRQRSNDAAQLAYIEYVDRDGELRKARPPKGPRRAGSLLSATAQAAVAVAR